MAKINFVTKDNLLYVWQKVKLLLSNKVDKVEGKGLSTNDLTDELKQKILNAGDSSFSGNYNDLINKPDLTVYAKKTQVITDITSAVADKVTETQMNTAISSATSNKVTESQVNTAISTAISGITQFDYSIVESLPENGKKGTIYLISNTGAGENIYDEYLYINNKFEKIGTTEMDLSGYVKLTDLIPVTNEEIDEIFAS